jgi:hypothetical protein
LSTEALLLIIAGVAVLATAVLAGAWLRDPRRDFPWFLLHFAIGIYGISAVVVLSLLHALGSTAAAILASIIAYSLGISTPANRPGTSGASSTSSSSTVGSGENPPA